MKSKTTTPKLSTEKPKNILFKPLTVDYKTLFKALAKGIGHTVALKWEELGNDTVEALSSLGLATDPSELAFLLVRRSLTAALFDLLGESSAQMTLDSCESEDAILLDLDSLLIEHSVEIDDRFMDRPLDLPIVSLTVKLLDAWLSKHKNLKEVSGAIAERFPSYFVYALNKEWRKNAKAYAPLKESISTPFTKAGEREWAWATYAALLQKRIQEPSFDEAFSLSQIFISPNAYFSERAFEKGRLDEMQRADDRSKKIVVSLRNELSGWLTKNDPEDAIRVISGGPGSGKSSFVRVFAAEVATKEKLKVLFIPLHLIDATKELSGEVARFVTEEGILLGNPLDPASPEPNLLIIFDGLDELASQGKAAIETSRSFIHEIERTVEKRNLVSVKLRVLISGRELVIQENENDFRRSRQVLTLLPYHIARDRSSNRENSEYVDASNLLDNDLRNSWWATYARLTGKDYTGLPRVLKRTDLDEITAQPLLNYLVALSYSRGEIDFTRNVDLNAIYEDLVRAVYERGYEKHRTFGPIRHMSAEDFVRILEEIGLAAWHGDGRTTSVLEIEQHCRASGVGRLLDLFQEGAEAGVTRLLAAFFFRRHGQRSGGEATFIFTHKSFGEYLASRRIARAVQRVVKEMVRRNETPDEGWDEKEALKHWIQICGPTALSEYIHKFLLRELMSLEIADAKVAQKHLQHLFGFVLDHGSPMEQLQLPSFKIAQFYSRNSEEALLAVLNACAMKSRVCSQFKTNSPTSFGAWLGRIQGQRSGPQNVLVANCLSYLDLSDFLLDICDFYGADLRNSKLRGVSAHFTNFCFANLTGADFTQSMLGWSNFENAVMGKTNFDGARLDEAVLLKTELESSTFIDASLQRVKVGPQQRRVLKSKGANFDRAIRTEVHPLLEAEAGGPALT